MLFRSGDADDFIDTPMPDDSTANNKNIVTQPPANTPDSSNKKNIKSPTPGIKPQDDKKKVVKPKPANDY